MVGEMGGGVRKKGRARFFFPTSFPTITHPSSSSSARGRDGRTRRALCRSVWCGVNEWMSTKKGGSAREARPPADGGSALGLALCPFFPALCLPPTPLASPPPSHRNRARRAAHRLVDVLAVLGRQQAAVGARGARCGARLEKSVVRGQSVRQGCSRRALCACVALAGGRRQLAPVAGAHHTRRAPANKKTRSPWCRLLPLHRPRIRPQAGARGTALPSTGRKTRRHPCKTHPAGGGPASGSRHQARHRVWRAKKVEARPAPAVVRFDTGCVRRVQGRG